MEHHQFRSMTQLSTPQVLDAYPRGEEGCFRTAAGTIWREVRVVSVRAKWFLDQQKTTVESMGKAGKCGLKMVKIIEHRMQREMVKT